MPYLPTRLGRLFYEERGASRAAGDSAFLLMHGLLYDGGIWKHCAEALSSLGRVLVVDGPGHGRSEAPPRFSLEDHAEALVDVFAELGVAKVIPIGLSWGGMVALRLAIRYPERLSSLVLISSSAAAETMARRLKFRLLIALVRRVGAPEALVRSQLAPLFFAPATVRSRPQLIEDLIRRANAWKRDGLARAALAASVHRDSVVEQLDRIRVPTLVIGGRQDLATPPECSEQLALGISGAQLHWVENAGHMCLLEQPQVVEDLVFSFVRSQLPR